MKGLADAQQRLATAPWLRRKETQDILGLLGGARGQARVVGGVVRDTLIGRTGAGGDLDIATELVPEAVMECAAAAGIAAYPTGIAHGTITLRHGETVAEVTTLRSDIETDGRRAVVRFGTDWTRDAERRDFSLNALYANPDGTLFDPLGGLADCLAGRVRFIGDPLQRIEEDRLRVFRFFRFSASHGDQHFDRDGLTACALAAGKLGKVSAERVGAEMMRLLALPKVALTLQTMVVSGILSVSAEVLRTLTSYELREAVPARTARLAIIIGDLGAAALKARWRLSNDTIAAAEAVRSAAGLLAEDRLNEAAYRHPDALGDALQLRAIQGHWSAAQLADAKARLETLEVPALPISGRDLKASQYRAGRALGDELRRLEQVWIESGFALDRAALLTQMRPPPA